MAADQTNQKPLEELALEVSEVTSAALEKAAQAYQQKEAEAREVNTKIPGVFDALVAANLLQPEEKEAAAKEMRNPVQVLEMLKLAAQAVQQQRSPTQLPATQVGPDGRPATVKSAGANGTYDRRSEFERERDAQYDRDLGRG
jgi:hypothetical protein